MNGSAGRPRLLLIGGGGGLAGRAIVEEFRGDWAIRSLHRARASSETAPGLEWVPGDVRTVSDWAPILRDVDLVVNLAWYRHGSAKVFRPLAEGLLRLISASERVGGQRWVQVSVPPAPGQMEASLPYLSYKRLVDRTLQSSSLSYSVVRPTMLFGPNDKLLTKMLGTVARYHRFPMFGDGEYHVSPIAATDLARIVRREALLRECRTVVAGGPVRWRYRDLTDCLFQALGRRPRYVRLSPAGSIRLARLLEAFGSHLLYAYEVEWLLSDLLGVPPYEGLDRPLRPVEPFLATEAARYAPVRTGGARQI